ncbi:MAG TPA: MBL fold metallo-hydrolase [Acidimicrobiales bacterium]|nr:MBL fold metallo-hydrolase [Acidimicrobiales bacterium]
MTVTTGTPPSPARPAGPARSVAAAPGGDVTVEIDVLSNAGGRSSGYLVRHGATSVLVDCGPGTSVTLVERGHIEALDAVVVTHEHADHASDVIGLAYARQFPERMHPIPLLAPASTLHALRHLDGLFAVPTSCDVGRTITSSFEMEALRMDGTPSALAGLSLAAHAVSHAVPSAALRFVAGDASVTFSSDTGACDALVEAARDADLFVCESTFLAGPPEQLDDHGHLTAALAAEMAGRAGARRVVLTHFSRADHVPVALATVRRALGEVAVDAAAPGGTLVL